jgi:cob(I)alamin adenosyltransferase
MSSQPGVDWSWWIGYLIAVVPAILGGWWLRGVKDRDLVDAARTAMRLAERRMRAASQIEEQIAASGWRVANFGGKWDARGDEEMGP